MNRIRKLIIALCILTFVAFGAFNVWHYISRDVEPPKISMDKDEIEVSIKADDEELLKGITAEDADDGDVTATLGVEKLYPFSADWTRKMSVVAFDNKGNTARAVRKVKYTDYTHPRFELEGPLQIQIHSYMNNPLNGLDDLVHVSDCLDGDITDRMSIRYDDNEIMEDENGGDYPVTFEVTNSAGDTQKIDCTLTVYPQNRSNQDPTPVLKKYIVYTEKGKKLDPEDYLKGVDYYGTTYKVVGEGGSFGNDGGQDRTIDRDRIKVDDDDVKYNKPGSYEIAYSVTDEQGNTGVTRLIVVVEEKL